MKRKLWGLVVMCALLVSLRALNRVLRGSTKPEDERLWLLGVNLATIGEQISDEVRR